MEDSYTDQCGSPIRDLGGSKPHTAIFRCIISLYTHPHHPLLKTIQKKEAKTGQVEHNKLCTRTKLYLNISHNFEIVLERITPVLLFLFSFLYPNLCPKWSKLFLSGLILSLQCFYQQGFDPCTAWNACTGLLAEEATTCDALHCNLGTLTELQYILVKSLYSKVHLRSLHSVMSLYYNVFQFSRVTVLCCS